MMINEFISTIYSDSQRQYNTVKIHEARV